MEVVAVDIVVEEVIAVVVEAIVAVVVDIAVGKVRVEAIHLVEENRAFQLLNLHQKHLLNLLHIRMQVRHQLVHLGPHIILATLEHLLITITIRM